MNKKTVISITVVLLLLTGCIAVVAYNSIGSGDSGDDDGSSDQDENGTIDDVNAANGTSVSIVLGTDVTVNGSAISSDASSAVYSSSGSGYTIINIVEAGTYDISGTADDLQIYVNAGDTDEVVLVLNGTIITCDESCAILIVNAYEPDAAGEAGVTIRMASGTESTIEGSHTDEYDAAIDSVVSLLIEGDGELNVIADNEGIETWRHLTIESGIVNITSDEDAINANEDGVSTITINGGTVFADSSSGSDGDGIDSNGYIYINGGVVYGFSSGENSGIDSDLGTIIDGGLVFATGKMNDGASASSDQEFISHSFNSVLSANKLVYVLDDDGDCVLAFQALASYSSFIFSSSELSNGDDYSIYVGGSIDGTFDAYGLCVSFTVTTAGTLQN